MDRYVKEMEGYMYPPRIGAVSYATPQGLGHLMWSFYGAGVVTRPAIVHHNKHPNYPHWYPKSTPYLDPRKPFIKQDGMEEWLRSVDVVLFFETPFNWDFINECHRRNVRTVLMPMYEWTPKVLPARPTSFLCPSKLDKDYFPHGEYIPVPVRTDLWRQKTTVKRFLHNAGHVGHREHKGTRQLIQALPHLKTSPRITLRCQYPSVINTMMHQELGRRNLASNIEIHTGYFPYDKLWEYHDAVIIPEKFNGLSLPLQEAYAAGLLVITTNRYPANDWLPNEPLIPVKSCSRQCITRNYLEFDEAEVDPKAIAEVIDTWNGADITDYSWRAKAWASDHSWSLLRNRYVDYFARVCSMPVTGVNP